MRPPTRACLGSVRAGVARMRSSGPVGFSTATSGADQTTLDRKADTAPHTPSRHDERIARRARRGRIHSPVADPMLNQPRAGP
jgi:hypothetical protein